MPTPVLLLSSDEQAVHVVSQVLTELGLAVERPAAASSAIREIELRSFSALVLDCDDLASAKLMFDALRRSQRNQGIPAIAVVSGGTGLPTAFRLGAEFVITKPVSLDQARHTLRTASTKVKKDIASAATAVVPTASAPARANGAAAGAHATSPSISLASPTAVPGTQPQAPTSVAPALKSKPVASTAVLSTSSATVPSRVVPAAPNLKAAPAPTPHRPASQTSSPRAKSDDPMLADLDDLENPGAFAPPPFTQLKLRRKTPILAFVCVMILLAGAGGYAAWTMRPDFRDFVMYEYIKVRALIGMPVPPPPAPVRSNAAPAQIIPPSTPAVPESNVPTETPATTGGSAPANSVAPPAPGTPSSTTPPANSTQIHSTPEPANPQH